MGIGVRSSQSKRAARFALPATILISTVLTLAVLELGARILLPETTDPLRNGRELMLLASKDKDIRYELTPGSKGRAWDTDVSINSAGFRGPEKEVDKKGKYRIVVLGDSITVFQRLKPHFADMM